MVSADEALPGREQPMTVAERHVVLDTPLRGPFPEGVEQAVFGMGCFWGAERIFWQAPGVYTTAVGYAGGITPNPTYEEVCSGQHRPCRGGAGRLRGTNASAIEEMLRLFWEGHDPTQGMRQGNDVGSQYRSLMLYEDEAQHARRAGLARDLPAHARRKRPRPDHD